MLLWVVPGLILARGTCQSHLWVSPPDSADQMTSPCNSQAGLGITNHGCGWSKTYLDHVLSPCVKVLEERTSCTFFFFFFGLFWHILGKEVCELLQRARTATSASILLLALHSIWKIPLSQKYLVWRWSESWWVGWRASRDLSQLHKPAGPSSFFLRKCFARKDWNALSQKHNSGSCWLHPSRPHFSSVNKAVSFSLGCFFPSPTKHVVTLVC